MGLSEGCEFSVIAYDTSVAEPCLQNVRGIEENAIVILPMTTIKLAPIRTTFVVFIVVVPSIRSDNGASGLPLLLRVSALLPLNLTI